MKKFKVVQICVMNNHNDSPSGDKSINRLEGFLNSGWSIVDVHSATIPSCPANSSTFGAAHNSFGGAVFIYILQSKDG
ncbi:MAG: hypothetical protein IJQ31_06000 [Thermoguttaceae bacterium]|nr:hypothetical protein [Thermoguttaceae bacterium]